MSAKLQDIIQIQYTKSVVFLYIRNEQSKPKKIPFITASKRIICFGLNLTKEVQGLHTENYKILKKIKKDIPEL